MNFRNSHYWTALAAITVLQTGCASWKLTHVPPGQSVELALAKKATAVEHPVVKSSPTTTSPVIEPGLPSHSDDAIVTVADFYTTGSLCMEQGHYADAIKAFEKALKLDPTFSDAWNNLAICYQNNGQDEKAIETFRKSKALTTR